MLGIDTIYDYWRLGNLLLGVAGFVCLMFGLKKQKEQWNIKTRDFWYSRLMWTVVCISLSAEGIYYGRGITYTLPLVTFASIVTLKALLRKGSWGYVEQNVR